jgi:hypothetical protein
MPAAPRRSNPDLIGTARKRMILSLPSRSCCPKDPALRWPLNPCHSARLVDLADGWERRRSASVVWLLVNVDRFRVALRTDFLKLAPAHARDYTGSAIRVCDWGVGRPVVSGPREAGSRQEPAPLLHRPDIPNARSPYGPRATPLEGCPIPKRLFAFGALTPAANPSLGFVL